MMFKLSPNSNNTVIISIFGTVCASRREPLVQPLQEPEAPCAYIHLHGPGQADMFSPHMMNYGQEESLLHHIGCVEMAGANELSCCVCAYAAIQPACGPSAFLHLELLNVGACWECTCAIAG